MEILKNDDRKCATLCMETWIMCLRLKWNRSNKLYWTYYRVGKYAHIKRLKNGLWIAVIDRNLFWYRENVLKSLDAIFFVASSLFYIQNLAPLTDSQNTKNKIKNYLSDSSDVNKAHQIINYNS